MATVGLDRLTYRYPGGAGPALDQVSVELGPGLTLVRGPSGGGKSTLLRLLNGLVPHFHGGSISGRATVAGLDVLATPTRRMARSVGFVFQDPELQGVYSTVDREVAFGLENLAVPPAEMPARISRALAEVGVGHLAGRRTATLSGGERQRVALASALVLDPEVVALDEPTSQLDPEGARSVWAAVSSLADRGRTVVIAEQRRPALAPDRVLEVAAGAAVPAAGTLERRPRGRPAGAGAGPEVWALDSVAAGFGGRSVVDGVRAGGRAGEVVALSGPNGGGKTTLLRLLAGVLRPAVGSVARPPGRIAYLPQNPSALLHRPSVLAEVRLTLTRAGEVEPAAEAEAAAEILDLLGLGGLAGRYPRDLSTGEMQRAALAAVLPGRPDLVLLDEPTRGMDESARKALCELVRRLAGRGAAVILATHDEELLEELADRVYRVAGGRVEEIARVGAEG